MPTEKITIEGSRGQHLSVRLDEPDETTGGYAVFAHCFTCSKNSIAASRVSKALGARGMGTLRFDFTGIGESGGDFAQSTFGSDLDDLRRVCDWLSEHRQPPTLLVGHSLGGAAVLAVAGEIEGVRCVSTIGAPADPEHVSKLFEGDRDTIEREGSAEVSLGGRPFRITKQFLDDLSAHDPEQAIAKLDRALMIFHSPVDSVVGIDNAATIFKWARHPKSFISLGHADHLLTDRKDAEFVAATLAPWVERFG
ncbi:MAG: alpha/beta hydrolase family protein [Phycisphaerales bacterium]